MEKHADISSAAVQKYHDQALVEPSVPFLQTTLPPSLVTLMGMHDAGSNMLPGGLTEPDPTAPVFEQYQGGSA